jgi:drug/metabolite transporter (DMT)-like permease
LNLLLVKLGVFTMKPVDAAQFRMFLIPTVLFVGSLVTSLTALPLVSVSTTVIFRAMTTLGVAVGDFLVFGKRFSVAELLCLVAVVIGAAVYAGLPPARNPSSKPNQLYHALVPVASSANHLDHLTCAGGVLCSK